MKTLLNSATIINAALFQALWFACVIGGANNQLWPSMLAATVMLAWQLRAKNRHTNDVLVVLVAILMGVIVDTAWTVFGLMDFSDPRPIYPITPGWILMMWVGFALTINHSLAWLANHPFLPGVVGFIGGPLAYYAGKRLGAVDYLIDTWLLSLILGIVWGIAVTILVKIGQTGLPQLVAPKKL